MAGVAYAETEMERTFQSPPVAARPWTYWWWLNSNVTREGITRDLEEMHRQGIQGVMIFNAGGGDTPARSEVSQPRVERALQVRAERSVAAGHGGQHEPLRRLGRRRTVDSRRGGQQEARLVGNAGRWPASRVANVAAAADDRQLLPRRRRAGDSRKGRLAPCSRRRFAPARPSAATATRRIGRRPTRPTAIRTRSGGPPSAPTPTAPAWIDYIYSEPLAASAIFLAGDKDGGPQNCALQTSDDGVSFKTLLPVEDGQGRSRSGSSFPKSRRRSFGSSCSRSYTPDVRLAEMWILRKGDQPPLRPGIKWWWFKSGNRGFWDWPKQGPAVMEEEYPEDGARRLPKHGSRRSHLEDGQGRKAPVGRARGPLDDLALRLHARRPAHALLFDRHRLRSRHARPDRHRDPFQALRRAAVGRGRRVCGQNAEISARR